MSWVRFHDEIRKGKKRGIPRAHRFVLMELASEARPKRGVIDLPVGMNDADGVCDILGGDKREVRAALKSFTTGPEPVIFFQDGPDGRQLVMPSWSRWNPSVETSGSSSGRVKKHREIPLTRDHQIDLSPPSTSDDEQSVIGTSDSSSRHQGSDSLESQSVTPRETIDRVRFTTVSHEAPPGECNGRETPPEEEKSRGEERKKNPTGSGARVRARGQKSELPPDWTPKPDVFDRAMRDPDIQFGPDRVRREAVKFRGNAEGNGRVQVNWDSAFWNWLIKARELDPSAPRVKAPTTREPTAEELDTPPPAVAKRVQESIVRGGAAPVMGDLFAAMSNIGKGSTDPIPPRPAPDSTNPEVTK